MSKYLLEVNNIAKAYSNRGKLFSPRTTRYAVRNVTFNIPKGTSLGLVGESGCGKTTLGKCILNLIQPDAGQVLYDGKELFDCSKKERIHYDAALRQKMQIIFQDPASSLNPCKTIEQAIEVGIRKHNMVPRNQVRDRCIEILQQCGLESFYMMRYPHELSGGQKQRVAIARALAVDPEFVVCDEPTAALDVSVQAQILNLMLDLKEERNLTYLFISHNLSIVRKFCDSIIIMYKGKIVEQDLSEEIYLSPLHPYTKLLLASIPADAPSDAKICRDQAPTHHRNIEPQNLNKTKAISSLQHDSSGKNGCAFAPRCVFGRQECLEIEPELKTLTDSRKVACHLV